MLSCFTEKFSAEFEWLKKYLDKDVATVRVASFIFCFVLRWTFHSGLPDRMEETGVHAVLGRLWKSNR